MDSASIIFLASKFVNSFPVEKRTDHVEIVRVMQEAHWYYTDILHGNEPDHIPGATRNTSRPATLTMFLYAMSRHLKWPEWPVKSVQRSLKDFWVDSNGRTRCGGILLNSEHTHCVIVQGYSSKNWSFPAGKIENDEPYLVCSKREVFEEVGYKDDEADFVDFISYKFKKRSYHMFMYYDVPMDFKFATQTRCEIRDILWVPVHKLTEYINTSHIQEELQKMIRHRVHDCRAPVASGTYVESNTWWTKMQGDDLCLNSHIPLDDDAKNVAEPWGDLSPNPASNPSRTMVPIDLEYYSSIEAKESEEWCDPTSKSGSDTHNCDSEILSGHLK